MLRKKTTAILASVSVVAMLSHGVLAQSAAGVTIDPNAPAETRFDQAEILRDQGTEPEHLALARTVHAALVDEGYTRSLVPLAELQMALGETAPAFETWKRAALEGNAFAAVRLAEGMIQGAFGNLATPAEGLELLQELAKNPDNERAIYALGDIYYQGETVPADPKRAFALFQQIPDNAAAVSRMGDLYLGGDLGKVDLDNAILAYRTAAALGRPGDLLNLAEAELAAGRFDDALETIDYALTEDVPGAYYRYARWHIDGELGPNSDPSEGAFALNALVEGGDAEAAAFAAYRYDNGPAAVRRIDLGKIAQVLEAGVESGDAGAARALARAYRRLDIPNAKSRHRTLVRDHGDLLGEDLLAEEIYALYDPRDHAASRSKAAVLLEDAIGADFAAGMMELRGLERTSYVYVLQKELAAIGMYDGRTNGLLTKATITAILDFCQATGLADQCRTGPITMDSSRAIVTALGARKAASG